MADAGKLEVKEATPASASGSPPEGTSTQDPSDSTVLKAYGKDTTLQASVSGPEAERMRELAQKGLAADQRWRESQTATAKAKEDTERAADGLAILDAAAILRENPEDVDAFKTVAGAFGYTEEAMAAIAAIAAQAQADPDPKAKGGGVPSPLPKASTEEEKWSALPRDVKVQLKQGFRDRRDTELKVALAKDPVLGDNNGSESRLATIHEMAVDEATRLMIVGDPDPVTGRNRTLAYGPEVVRKAVENVRQRIEGLGTHQDVSDQLPAPGAGRAPSGGNSRHPATKPKRVPITDPKYGEYFQDFLQYEALKGGE